MPSLLFFGLNSHVLGGSPAGDTQLTTTSSGAARLGASTMLSRPRGPPHQGQFVSGNGDDAVFDALFLYSMTSFFTCSIVLAVADRPTHSPTEKRTSPSFSALPDGAGRARTRAWPRAQ